MKYRRLLVGAITSFVLIALVIACAIGRWAWIEHHSVSHRIAERLAAHDGKPIVFSEMTPFAWDKVYFFGPYTSRAQIEQAIGFSWPGADDSAIQGSKGSSLIVFVKDGRVVESFDQSRGLGDFSGIETPNGLTPDQARFIIERRAPDGWEFMRLANADGSPVTKGEAPAGPPSAPSTSP